MFPRISSQLIPPAANTFAENVPSTQQEVSVSHPPAAPLMPVTNQNRLPTSVQQLESELTGVVIWPNELKDRSTAEVVGEKLKDQKTYATYLSSKIPGVGRKLANREIQSFKKLWEEASNVRCGAPDLGPDGHNHKLLDLYRTTRVGRSDEMFFRFTPLTEQKYQHIARAVRADPDDETSAKSRISANIPGEPSDAEPVGLTYIITTKIPGTGDKPSPVMCHTLQRHLPRIMKHLESLFQQTINAPDTASFENNAARLYWWSAHAMLDKRGSASKTEIVLRALYAQRGLHCPLWKPGISADLEAMIRTEDQWLEKINEFRWPAPEIEAILGELSSRQSNRSGDTPSSPQAMHPAQSRLLNQFASLSTSS